jgi:hypothetical protein
MTPSLSVSGRQPFFCSGSTVVVLGEGNGSSDRSSLESKALGEGSTKTPTRFVLGL